MKRLLNSIPFLFILGFIIWMVNSLITSMFVPETLQVDTSLFAEVFQNVYMRLMIISFSIFLYMILFRIFMYEKEGKLLRDAFNHSFPMCITGAGNTFIEANDAYRDVFGGSMPKASGRNRLPLTTDEVFLTGDSAFARIARGEKEVVYEESRETRGENRHYIVKAKPVTNSFGELVGIVETFDDITDRIRLEEEKQHLIEELRKSLEQVKLLSGVLPVCPSCKQVRVDEENWEQLESYVASNSEAEITYSMCSDCRELAEDLSEIGREEVVGPSWRKEDQQWLKLAC